MGPADSVTAADRRGADRGTESTTSSRNACGTGTQDHSIAGTPRLGATVPVRQSGGCTIRRHRCGEHPPVVFQLGHGSHAPRPIISSYCLKEPLRVVWPPPPEHAVGDTPKFLSDDRQRLGVAVLADQFLVVVLGRRVGPQEQAGSLAEGPLQVDVANLGVLACGSPTSRLVRTFHQPSVGDEVADLREATDVLDLIARPTAATKGRDGPLRA